MPDDLTNRGPQDRSRISLLEPHEVQYWADKFNVSKERLSEAVRNVGHSADAVERELKRLAQKASREDSRRRSGDSAQVERGIPQSSGLERGVHLPHAVPLRQVTSTTLADFSRARDSQITFSVTHGWSAFWRGRPWLAGRRIGETSSDVGSSRFWIGWVTKHGDKCARSTCRD